MHLLLSNKDLLGNDVKALGEKLKLGRNKGKKEGSGTEMINCRLAKREAYSKNWYPLLTNLKIQRKNSFTSQSLHLYHYAGNNPVNYVDPSGKYDIFDMFYDMSEESYGTEAADYIIEHDSSVKMAVTINAAANGDPKAQKILAESAKVAAKQTAVDGLEVAANTAGIVSEITGDLALEAVFVQPEAAGGLGTASEIASIVEVGARGLKVVITKDSKDFEKLKKSGIKNGTSIFFGRIAGKLSEKFGSEVSILVSGTVSKVDEKIVDKTLNNKKQNEE